MVPCTQPHLHSFRFPCGGASIHALSFAATCWFALYISQQHINSYTPSHGSAFGFCQPSDNSTLPSCSPSHSGCWAVDYTTYGHPYQGHAFASRLSSYRPSSYFQTIPCIHRLTELYAELVSSVVLPPLLNFLTFLLSSSSLCLPVFVLSALFFTHTIKITIRSCCLWSFDTLCLLLSHCFPTSQPMSSSIYCCMMCHSWQNLLQFTTFTVPIQRSQSYNSHDPETANSHSKIREIQ